MEIVKSEITDKVCPIAKFLAEIFNAHVYNFLDWDGQEELYEISQKGDMGAGIHCHIFTPAFKTLDDLESWCTQQLFSFFDDKLDLLEDFLEDKENE